MTLDVVTTPDVVITVFVVIVAITAWWLIANETTCYERKKIIDHIFNKNRPYKEWKRLQRMFDEISYDKHHWYLFTFRKPPYNPELTKDLK